MPVFRAAAMSRFLLASLLYFFAVAALANEGAASEGVGESVKRGKSTAVTSSQDSESGTVVAPASPARSSTPRSATPRWHSLLPGMIR